MNQRVRAPIGRYWRLVILTSLFAPVAILFGNCGPSFQLLGEAGETTLASVVDPGADEDPIRSSYLSTDKDFACAPAETGSMNRGFRRLSGVELRNSLEALFGTGALSTPAVVNVLPLLPVEGNNTIVDSWSNSIDYVEGLLEVGKAVGESIFADPQRIEQLLPGCSATANVSATCRTSFAGFAKRAFRRPLAPAEVEAYEQFVAGFTDRAEGRKYAVIRVLMSPFFHQHVEIEDGPVVNGRVRLGPFEVAARLAYRLTAYPPDDELLRAAETGQLETAEAVLTQGRRIVNTVRARKHFRDFLTFWLRTETKVDPHPLMQQILGINPAGMTAEMKTEFDRWVDYVVFEQNGKFEDLMQGQIMFPGTPRLAQLLETPQAATAVTAPAYRGGLLFRPLVMNTGQATSNPIARGVLLRKRLLCMNLPPPDAVTVNSRLDSLNELSPLEYSTRDMVTHVTNSPNCMGCHAHINSVGFAFENFGPFGNYRTIEKMFDEKGQLVAQHPVDTAVASVPLPGRNPIAIASSVDLMRELAQTPAAMRCYSQQLFRYTRIRDARDQDGCALNAPANVLIGGQTVKESLVQNAANDDIFWRKAGQ